VPGESAGIFLDFRAPGSATPAERRGPQDRRSCPTRCLSRYTLAGRRRAARRTSEGADYYVDKFESRYLWMIALILVLCVLDGGLSVRIRLWGGSEINRLAAGLLVSQPILLLAIKLGLTAVGLAFLLLHKNFKVFGRFRTGGAISFILAVYLTLAVYEIYAVISIDRIMGGP